MFNFNELPLGKEALSELNEGKNKWFAQQLRNNQPFVDDFAEMHDVGLLEITVGREKGVPEPMYIFTDDLGAYSIEGIKKSLC
jgi:hypothetical protein